MIDHEMTDPAGGALTITHDHQGVWITATEDRDEVTVGPFPVTSLTEAVTVESDAEVSGDLMDGGVTAAAIENEAETLDAKASRLAAFGRSLGYPPEWTNAPAVVAWHRSDHRTEHDGTPGNPRIWSPGYRTTERWSTPSLRNVHWSDLVDVTPLAAIEAEVVSPELARSLVQENDELRARIGRVEEARDLYRQDVMTAERREQEFADRAEKAEENVRAREEMINRLAARAENPRPLTADDITAESVDDAMIKRAVAEARRQAAGMCILPEIMADILMAALTPPPSRPEGAEGVSSVLSALREDDGEWMTYASDKDLDGLADALAELGVRVTGAES